MYRVIAATFAFFLSLGILQAQQINVTGTVTDSKGEPIVGAYVVLKGTTVGTTCNADGIYSISVPAKC
ncbi:MAG: carboxypeptidase-like regulatory domain-containing protein [Bacteroidales bacterium]|nr:carboxypeptidase-like regulatory domain-containing protein [Bacteroidales bacterium]MCI2144940.1 carboxypeptidase-like regulatory domain-containing protein [Bacteroidales bacterium]